MSNNALEQLKRIASAPIPQQLVDRERVRESLDLLTEELAFAAYDMLLQGTALGRKADHATAMEFSAVVADSLREGFDKFQNSKGET